ncbi:MAG: hypothetical protein NVSMB64_21160 [Candidatus Velthaea sp.]
MAREELTLLPESAARRAIGDQPIALRVLRPPYPALGVGTLRVLRVREREGAGHEITAGYDNYQRLDGA